MPEPSASTRSSICCLRPDGKSQVTVEYSYGKPKRIHTILLSNQHSEEVENDTITKDLIEKVAKNIAPEDLLVDTNFFVNPSGRFVIGGPVGDTGLTGRKIVVDAYGPTIPVGGGAFSGKDPSKVDRSAAYMTRYIAKNIVAAQLADKCEVQVAYCIGVSQPMSVNVDTFNTGKISDSDLVNIVNKVFDLRPEKIIEHLDLKKPIYRKIAAYGHFGRGNDYRWERTDKKDELANYL